MYEIFKSEESTLGHIGHNWDTFGSFKVSFLSILSRRAKMYRNRSYSQICIFWGQLTQFELPLISMINITSMAKTGPVFNYVT